MSRETRAQIYEKTKSLLPKKPMVDPQTEQGAIERTVNILSNYFKITSGLSAIYQYAVTFEPFCDSKSQRYAFIASHREFLGGTFVFDGMQLFLLKKLENQNTYLKSVREKDGAEFEITVQLTKELEPNQSYQLYSIIFRKILRLLKLKEIGRNYFNPENPVSIPQHNMQLWPGYSTAIAQYDGGVMLNIDAIFKVLRTDTVLDHIIAKRGDRNVLDRQLIGQVVLTRYNNRSYRIDELDWTKNPLSTFKKSTGEEISYAAYYKNNYNLEIKDTKQPLILHRAKKREKGTIEILYLIPELCCMTGFTDEVRADFRIMKDLSTHLIVNPGIRQRNLENFVKDMEAKPEIQQELSAWQLKFAPSLLSVQGKVLKNEKIYLGQNKSFFARNGDWGREMKQVSLIQSFPLDNWVVFFSRRNEGVVREFVGMMERAGPPMGIQVRRPQEIGLNNDRPGEFVEAIQQVYQPGQTQLIVCILPDQRKDRYDAIKKHCIADGNIVSQCVLQKTLNNKKIAMSAVSKIIMQMNCKLGGQLWAVEIPLKIPTMVIGLDVYHDSARKGTSVVGFCASVNKSMTKYYSCCMFQRKGQEIVDGLKQSFTRALKFFHQTNNILPQKIIVYRDGVGAGQVSAVTLHETPQIKACFAEFGQGYNPELMVMIVTKRINTRLMERQPNGVQNPPAGTLVTTGCTTADGYDFYLCPQQPRQGTTTPTHYRVVHDSTTLAPIHVQSLTYKLSHLYYNWPGTVRVPAPCQYAHKIAFIIGQSVHTDPHVGLSDKLYFL